MGKAEVDSKERRMKKCLPGQTLLSQDDKNKTVVCLERNKPNKKKEKIAMMTRLRYSYMTEISNRMCSDPLLSLKKCCHIYDMGQKVDAHMATSNIFYFE